MFKLCAAVCAPVLSTQWMHKWCQSPESPYRSTSYAAYSFSDLHSALSTLGELQMLALLALCGDDIPRECALAGIGIATAWKELESVVSVSPATLSLSHTHALYPCLYPYPPPPPPPCSPSFSPFALRPVHWQIPDPAWTLDAEGCDLYAAKVASFLYGKRSGGGGVRYPSRGDVSVIEFASALADVMKQRAPVPDLLDTCFVTHSCHGPDNAAVLPGRATHVPPAASSVLGSLFGGPPRDIAVEGVSNTLVAHVVTSVRAYKLLSPT